MDGSEQTGKTEILDNTKIGQVASTRPIATGGNVGKEKASRVKNRMLLIISMAAIAVIGVGLSITGVVWSFGKNSEIKLLKAEIEEKDTIIVEQQRTLTKHEGAQSETGNPLLSLYAGKCLNCEVAPAWTITTASVGFLEKCLSLHISEYELAGTISWDDLSELYWPDETRKTGKDNVEINVSGRIVDIYIGSFGQTVGNETVLLLMEDGSVEYISLRKSLQDGEFRIHGKVPGVEHIVKFYTAIYYGGRLLAQRSDGDYYDLTTILLNTGSYD